MRSKGFTLIELLAVLVILAIIALIATPIILGIIKDAKKQANERSAEMYYKALENAIAQQQLDGSNPITGTFSTDNGKNLYLEDGSKADLIVEYDGPEITVERIDIYEDGSVYIQGIKSKSDNKTLANSYGIKHYTNGEVIYYNVKTGKSCTNYHEDNSKTGYNGLTTTKTTDNQNSCLKFYAFNDFGKENLNLLLDHNTTATFAWITQDDYDDDEKWNQNIMNIKGPKTLLKQLYNDTKDWNGTITPSNYIMDQTVNGDDANYTIAYSEIPSYDEAKSPYKARLITAQEIAQIIGADKNIEFDETKYDKDLFYFETLTSNPSSSCVDNDNNTICIYSWLYDRTYTGCKSFGCLNNSDLYTIGYWTSSSLFKFSNSSGAWGVVYKGYLGSTTVKKDNSVGVRPVITVLKDKLSGIL